MASMDDRGMVPSNEEQEDKAAPASEPPPSSGSQRQQRGFAAMDEERQRKIASKGGKAAHEKGTAHEFTSEEAREAGRKGGMARSANRKKAASSTQ